ncbi:MAG: GNAT family N-acetyltransferase [bacterium]|nr:GNAT family N-acetyltransferase [bacterium]
MAWHKMRCKLWKDPCPEFQEAEWLFAKSSFVVWLAETDSGEPIGFLEAQTCNRADGCDSDCILYIEGWYVEPEYQHQGVGTALMQAAEAYARGCGWQEIASDALLENEISHRAHKKLGFQEVDRQISYMKKL